MDLAGDILAHAPARHVSSVRSMLHGRALRYIDEVARQGSIRKAAKVLHIAPSAINRHIIEVEGDLNAQIFERLPRGLKLTSTGELLIAHIRDTLRAHERMRAQVRSLRGLSRGEVTIATMATLAAGRLADVVAQYREAHPLVHVRVMVSDRSGVTEMVASGRAEFALGYNLPQDSRLQRVAEFQHRLGAVVAKEHPLALKKSVRVADCMIYPLVLPDPSSSLRDLVDKLAPVNAEVIPAVETNSMELMKRVVRQSQHVTFLNRVDVDQELRDGDFAFLPLVGAAGRQRLSLVHRVRGTLSPASSRFIQLALECFDRADETK
jgi:DNA-binding transcriptional LysR family regulator